MILDDEQTTSAEYVERMPLARLRPHPHNPRRTRVDDDADLTASIAAQGVIEPIVVVPDPDDHTMDNTAGRFLVVAGHRRWHSSEAAGLDTIPARILNNLDEPTIEEWMLIENSQRADLDPLDEARAIHRLVEHHGIAQKHLAAKLGRSQSHVSKRLALLKLPLIIQVAVSAGTVGIEQAALCATLPETALAKVAETVRRGGMTDIAIASALTQHQRQRATDLARKKGAKSGLPELADAWGWDTEILDGADGATHWRVRHDGTIQWLKAEQRDDIEDDDDDVGQDESDEEYQARRATGRAEKAARDALLDTLVANLAGDGAPDADTKADLIIRLFVANILLEGDEELYEAAQRAGLDDDNADPEQFLLDRLDETGDWLELAYDVALHRARDLLRNQMPWGSVEPLRVTATFFAAHGWELDDVALDVVRTRAPMVDTPDVATIDEQVDASGPATTDEVEEPEQPQVDDTQPKHDGQDEPVEVIVAEQPWRNYDGHPPDFIHRMINRPETTTERLQHIIDYETAHKGRADVIDAATARLGEHDLEEVDA